MHGLKKLQANAEIVTFFYFNPFVKAPPSEAENVYGDGLNPSSPEFQDGIYNWIDRGGGGLGSAISIDVVKEIIESFIELSIEYPKINFISFVFIP